MRVNGELFESKHAIEAYCHFLRLLMHFLEIYPALGKIREVRRGERK